MTESFNLIEISMQSNICRPAVEKGGFPVEYLAMSKRGPYKKKPKTPPPAFRRNFLAKWRTWKEWTQQQLADESGVSIGMISSIEQGDSGYSAESLHKLANAIGVPPGMILDVDPEGDEPLWSLVANATDTEKHQIAQHAGIIVSKKRAGRGKK